jgi:hypothetical protein
MSTIQNIAYISLSIFGLYGKVFEARDDPLGYLILPFDDERAEVSENVIECLSDDLHFLASHNQVLLNRCPFY